MKGHAERRTGGRNVRVREILTHTKWHYATNYLLVLVSPTAQSFSWLDQSELRSSCLFSGGLSWQLAIDFFSLFSEAEAPVSCAAQSTGFDTHTHTHIHT